MSSPGATAGSPHWPLSNRRSTRPSCGPSSRRWPRVQRWRRSSSGVRDVAHWVWQLRHSPGLRRSFARPSKGATQVGTLIEPRASGALFLEDVGVLGARELLPIGDLHHVGIDLQPVAIGVQEVEGTAPTAPKGVPGAVAALRPVDEGPLDNLDALAPQVSQSL